MTTTNLAYRSLAVAVQVIARIDPDNDRLCNRILGRVRAAMWGTRVEEHDELVPELHQWPTGGEDDTVDQIDADDALRCLATLRKTVSVSENDLVAVRVHGAPAREVVRGRSARHIRADASRFARRLERLLAA